MAAGLFGKKTRTEMSAITSVICGIYTITNRINGKRYVGCSRNVQQRWLYHRAPGRWKRDGLKSGMKIARAFREYGIENFRFEVVETCAVSKLSTREILWISKLKPEYNSTAGGFGKAIRKLNGPTEEMTVIRVSRGVHRRLKARARKLGIHIQTLFARCVKMWLSLPKKKQFPK